MKRGPIVALAGLFALTVLGGCASSTQVEQTGDIGPVAYLEGAFSSKAQSETEAAYFNVLLHHARIWPARDDGVWVYVEQAIASSATQPYRQRVYQFMPQGHTGWVSKIYELPDPESAAGAWADTSKLDRVGPDALKLRAGCDVYLNWDERDQAWVGGTRNKECLSSLRGATYATSEVRLARNVIESWDRGFDASDAQVWGAQEGPYVFRRAD